MPTYEYYCQDCEKKFETKASIEEKEKGLKMKCPECGSSKTTQFFGSGCAIIKGKSSTAGGGCCGSSGCCGR